MKDKPKSHISSSEWLGSMEVSLCMSYFLDADCCIQNVSNGNELKSSSIIACLREHFKRHGTPVMIGGDVKAFTILGIDVVDDEDVRYLILDPHYTGSDANIKQIC